MAKTRNDAAIEWSRLLISEALGGSELIKATYGAHQFPLHAHPQYVIGFVERGAKVSRHGFRDLTVSEGMAMLLNPFEEHTTGAASAHWIYAAVYPTAEVISEYLEDCSEAFRFKHPLMLNHRMNRMISELYDAVKVMAPSLDIQTRFLDLLCFLQSTCAGADATAKTANAAAVATMRELLESDPAVDVSLADVSSAAGLPRLTALRTFRRQVGCTPHVYRTSRRIAAAKQSLLRGDDVAAVAIANGFFDQSHFTRTFKRWTGMTPCGFVRATS